MISSSFMTALLWGAALSSALMAGVYFAFSAFIMPAFGKISAKQSITAMNSINNIILRSWFMPLFLGSSIVSVLLIIIAYIDWDKANAGVILLAGLVYFFGMFICTIAFNVPLNNSLKKTELHSDNLLQIWSHYQIIWTRWNHLRTTSSLISLMLFIWILTCQ